MSGGETQNLVLAVPSKGRLQENATAFFARAGLSIQQGRGARDYRGTLAGLPGVEIAFPCRRPKSSSNSLPGGAHMGVTGEDLVREMVADADAQNGAADSARIPAMPMSSSPCRRPGSTSAQWPISTMSRSLSARRTTARGCGLRPNMSISRAASSPATASATIESSKASERPKVAPASTERRNSSSISLPPGATLAANALEAAPGRRHHPALVRPILWPRSRHHGMSRLRRIARLLLSRIAADGGGAYERAKCAPSFRIRRTKRRRRRPRSLARGPCSVLRAKVRSASYAASTMSRRWRNGSSIAAANTSALARTIISSTRRTRFMSDWRSRIGS